MNREREFSEEFLNAFIDDQLALEDRIRVYVRLQRDEALCRRIGALRKISGLVRFAYNVSPEPGRRRRRSRGRDGHGVI